MTVYVYTWLNSGSTVNTGIAQDIRLIGGSADNEGRVEVFRSGQWQTVCDDGWDLNDADVACRQLGYGYAIRVVTNALFGRGTGGQWEAFFSCTGRESGLEYCSTSSSSCGHSEDVGIICSNSSKYINSSISSINHNIARLYCMSNCMQGRNGFMHCMGECSC